MALSGRGIDECVEVPPAVTRTATDDLCVASVYYQLNGATWTSASSTNGFTNWTANATLAPGTIVKALGGNGTVSVDGALPDQFSYRLLVEFEAVPNSRTATNPSLRDAYIRWSPAPFTFTAGQFKLHEDLKKYLYDKADGVAKWEETGEVLYVRGQHGDKLHILTAANDIPFTPAGRHMALAPDSILVRSASRYPITEAGIGNLLVFESLLSGH